MNVKCFAHTIKELSNHRCRGKMDFSCVNFELLTRHLEGSQQPDTQRQREVQVRGHRLYSELSANLRPRA